jgi:hypothetical protein
MEIKMYKKIIMSLLLITGSLQAGQPMEIDPVDFQGGMPRIDYIGTANWRIDGMSAHVGAGEDRAGLIGILNSMQHDTGIIQEALRAGPLFNRVSLLRFSSAIHEMLNMDVSVNKDEYIQILGERRVHNFIQLLGDLDLQIDQRLRNI